MEAVQPLSIQKELIPALDFLNGEVLNSTEEIRQRQLDLEKAMILGNAYRRKVKIFFETSEGMCQVETTIWASTEKNIILKGGVVIPIHCIRRVSVY